jgi:hypothetical protein
MATIHEHNDAMTGPQASSISSDPAVELDVMCFADEGRILCALLGPSITADLSRVHPCSIGIGY